MRPLRVIETPNFTSRILYNGLVLQVETKFWQAGIPTFKAKLYVEPGKKPIAVLHEAIQEIREKLGIHIGSVL